ncbi:MAG: helix-turn-helix transcriptional regulator [Bilophila wadsworthia]
MRAADAAKYLGIALSTFWRWVSQGRLPKGKRLSPRCTVWMRRILSVSLPKVGGVAMQRRKPGWRPGLKKIRIVLVRKTIHLFALPRAVPHASTASSS